VEDMQSQYWQGSICFAGEPIHFEIAYPSMSGQEVEPPAGDPNCFLQWRIVQCILGHPYFVHHRSPDWYLHSASAMILKNLVVQCTKQIIER